MILSVLAWCLLICLFPLLEFIKMAKEWQDLLTVSNFSKIKSSFHSFFVALTTQVLCHGPFEMISRHLILKSCFSIYWYAGRNYGLLHFGILYSGAFSSLLLLTFVILSSVLRALLTICKCLWNDSKMFGFSRQISLLFELLSLFRFNQPFSSSSDFNSIGN